MSARIDAAGDCANSPDRVVNLLTYEGSQREDSTHNTARQRGAACLS